MKIEMGESLFYSWLRHVKECQVVQTNWKPSPTWTLYNEEWLGRFMEMSKERFAQKFGIDVFKSSKLSQLLTQAEIDAIGIAVVDDAVNIYAVDVAYHEDGLNYGDRNKTVTKVTQKCLRAVMCLHGYFDAVGGEIIFASPKIHNAVISDMIPCVEEVNKLLKEVDSRFTVRVLANEDFEKLVLEPILYTSEGISDTSELFLRSFQLLQMFEKKQAGKSVSKENVPTTTLSELKIGKIAQTLLRDTLERGISDDELRLMQDAEYSKRTFGIDFPLLVAVGEYPNPIRYYSKPLKINGIEYKLCSQWFETPANNDRPLLMEWIERSRQI